MWIECWSARRDAQIRFLAAQIEILQSRLPGNRVIVAPQERLGLLRLGVEVGRQIKDFLAIVNANAFVESWIGKLRRECLDHFCCFSLGHVDHIAQAYATYHNLHRPHQSLDNMPLPRKGKRPPILPLEGTIHWRHFLGGLLKHYFQAAA